MERWTWWRMGDWSRAIPLRTGNTPLAKQRPPNLLLKTLLFSNVAEALLVISTPAAWPSKIRFFRRVGWLWLLMRTPAWALRKMSFSSNTPGRQEIMTGSWCTWENQRGRPTSASVEDTNASVSTIVDLVEAQYRIAVCLDPHTRHGIVKDLIVFNVPQATIVHQDPSVLSTPDLVTLDQRVAPGPACKRRHGQPQSRWKTLKGNRNTPPYLIWTPEYRWLKMSLSSSVPWPLS